MEREILPWLREQEGFLDLITLADGSEVTTISFWDHKDNVEACNACGYPAALKQLGDLFEGTTHVKTFDVVTSTFERLAEPSCDMPGDGRGEIGYRPYQNGF
jgi:heme-degrading monooxygenase HmoA